MGLVWLGFKFRMELHRYKVRVILDFHDLNEVFLRVYTGEIHSFLFKYFSKLIIELVSMPMPLGNCGPIIHHKGKGVFFYFTGVSPQAHCPAHIPHPPLLL